MHLMEVAAVRVGNIDGYKLLDLSYVLHYSVSDQVPFYGILATFLCIMKLPAYVEISMTDIYVVEISLDKIFKTNDAISVRSRSLACPERALVP